MEHLQFGMIVDRPIPFEKRTKLRIPLFSATVQAGFPSPADNHMDKSLDLNEHLVSYPGSTFFVKAKGDSMKDAGIIPFVKPGLNQSCKG